MPRPAMTPRQRMLTAIRNAKPDRVPVAPDISAMVPTRLAGRGFYSVFIDSDPPLWRAYLDALRHFGMDGWFMYGHVPLVTLDVTATTRWVVERAEERVQEITHHTPDGDLTTCVRFTDDNPPQVVKKPIADIDRDFPRFRHLLGEIVSADYSIIALQRAELGELGVLGCGIATPGFQMWFDYFEGGIFTLTDLMADRPELLDELRELHHARLMSELGHLLAAKPDFILTGGSGSITMASPELWRRYSFPTLRDHCRVIREAGCLSMVHSCGKERHLVEVCSRETDLNCINPLEIPPMGDCTLREAKEIVRGTNLSLMGNLHTTNVMLLGTVDEVKRAARQAIEDAWEGGGFILSTGDQCGRDTPDANIRALVEVAAEYRYD